MKKDFGKRMPMNYYPRSWWQHLMSEERRAILRLVKRAFKKYEGHYAISDVSLNDLPCLIRYSIHDVLENEDDG